MRKSEREEDQIMLKIYFGGKYKDRIFNVLPKELFYSADEIIYITDNIYQNKGDSLKKKKSALQGMISEFQSRKEKINQNNATDLENQRTKLTEMLDQKNKRSKR